MSTKYFIDIERFSLTQYRTILEKSELLPGRRILYEKTKERFDLLTKHGIKNLLMLVQALKSSDKIKQLSKETNIPVDYLTILRREVNRLLPKPVSISDFPDADKSLIGKLNKKGIKNTLQLFEQCDTKKKRTAYAQAIDVPISALEELTKLSDLSRIWGVGPIFCRIFYETGTDTIKKVAIANAQNLHDKLTEINKEKIYKKAKFTVKDVALCVDIAHDLPKTIEI
jgi:nucleotidyltransferase/DNA polymerase involved in DNA repair